MPKIEITLISISIHRQRLVRFFIWYIGVYQNVKGIFFSEHEATGEIWRLPESLEIILFGVMNLTLNQLGVVETCTAAAKMTYHYNLIFSKALKERTLVRMNWMKAL